MSCFSVSETCSNLLAKSQVCNCFHLSFGGNCLDFYSRAAASLMMVWVGIVVVVKTFVSLVHHAFWNSRLALLLIRRLSQRSFLASL